METNQTLSFTKMEGAGNDYIYFNCFDQQIEDPAALSVALSDRHFGVGGDGIVLICPPERPDQADARMRMFNADGSEGRMCGNAIRCVGKYLYENGVVPRLEMRIETLSGLRRLELHVEEGAVVSVTADMGPALLEPGQVPVDLPGNCVVGRPVSIGGAEYAITCLSMGNPHCVVFWPEALEDLPIEKIGPLFERDPLFPQGVNTEFVRVLEQNHIQMRVWERGSGETLACGTGACAAAVASALAGHCAQGEDIRVELLGGALTIRWDGQTVWMTGPARTVFHGTVATARQP